MALTCTRDAVVRTRNHRFSLAVLFVGVACGGVLAASDSSASQKDGERTLEEGRTLLDAHILNAARNFFAQCTQQDPKSATCFFDLARTEFYLVKAEDIAKHTEASRKMLDNAVGDAQKAVALNDRSADAHALLADLYGAKITGMMSGMRYGPKAGAETQRALQLDPNDALVYAVQGRKYYYTPSAFGGDIDKAIESFKRAVALDPHSDEDFAWLAKAYRKKGDAAHEKEAIAQALSLNSRSVFAQRVQTGLE
jgi:tetratricopeptide (TPR) repeat protein